MEALLEFAQLLYRTARHTPFEHFQDRALVALGEHVRFETALWFAGRMSGGRLQVHRLHAYRMPPGAVETAVVLVRQHARALAVAAPCRAHGIDAAQRFAQPGSAPALAQARRLGRARQLLIAGAASGDAGAEWLSLHRAQSDAPFDEGDRTTLRLLMPHLSESRRVNRALCLRRASSEPLAAAAPHRVLTLPDGTVLHCGRRVSEAIGATWAHWDGVRLPAPLLAAARREDVLPLGERGETLRVRRFSDSLLLSLHAIPIRERLTRREYEVARLLAAGDDEHAVAHRCGLVPGTVRNIVRRCCRKLGIRGKGELVRLLARAESGA